MADFRHPEIRDYISEAIEKDPLEKVLAARESVKAARSINSTRQIVKTILEYSAALDDFWWDVKQKARDEMTERED